MPIVRMILAQSQIGKMEKENQMESDKDDRFWSRAILVTFLGCWFIGESALLVGMAMGFENGFLGSYRRELGERIGDGFNGAFIGALAAIIGIVIFAAVVKLVHWGTGFEIADVSFMQTWRDD